jgi:hypothetical protein
VHYSYAIVDGSVYVVGVNKASEPAKHLGYHGRVTEPKIHSELDAYKKLRKIVPIGKVNWEIVNVRVNRSGEMKMSKPCIVCETWLREVGCTKVTYTTEVGWNEISL